MYSFLLSFHSCIRWLVLLTILISLVRSYYGWLSAKSFSTFDNKLRITTLSTIHLQAVLGMILYSTSPIIRYFFSNFKEAVHEKEFRFFGMEHSLMMVTAVILITVGAISSKSKTTNQGRFKTLAIWFSIAVLIIAFSIPWSFGDFTAHRPLFRGF